MALIKQQDVVHLQVSRPSQVAETVKAHLDTYPAVRIISLQVLSMPLNLLEIDDLHLFLVVETT